MKRISYWAKHNTLQARLFIILIKITLAWLAILLGKTLLETGFHLSPLLSTASIFIFSIAVILYPRKTFPGLTKNQLYAARKSCDCILAATTFIFICVFVNNHAGFIPFTSSPASASSAVSIKTPTAEEILASLQYRDKKSLTRLEKGILKKEFGKQLKVYAKAKITGKNDDAAKAVLIILTIIGAIGLTIVLAGLACSLSCSGSDGLAILVVILGLTAIIWGTILAVKAIKRGRTKKHTEAEAPLPANP